MWSTVRPEHAHWLPPALQSAGACLSVLEGTMGRGCSKASWFQGTPSGLLNLMGLLSVGMCPVSSWVSSAASWAAGGRKTGNCHLQEIFKEKLGFGGTA